LHFTGFVTGTIIITSNVGLIVEVLELARQYCFKDLENATIQTLKSALNLKNICSILNIANLYDLSDLKHIRGPKRIRKKSSRVTVLPTCLK
jgi:hypothetical protein